MIYMYMYSLNVRGNYLGPDFVQLLKNWIQLNSMRSRLPREMSVGIFSGIYWFLNNKWIWLLDLYFSARPTTCSTGCNFLTSHLCNPVWYPALACKIVMWFTQFPPTHNPHQHEHSCQLEWFVESWNNSFIIVVK